MQDEDLLKACQVLFGPEVDVSQDFLYYIQLSGIKSAYRKIALLTHPDRRDAAESRGANEDFIKANWAYESLSNFIKVRDRVPRRVRRDRRAADRSAQSSRPKAQGANPTAADSGEAAGASFFRGPLPKRVLLFGQYLFYSGLVSWEALIRAIVWQRGQRPRLGAIAESWGWLRHSEARRINQLRKPGEPIGEALVRLGILDRAQLNALLHSQRKRQRPLGEYFVVNGYLNRRQLIRALSECSLHNRKYS